MPECSKFIRNNILGPLWRPLVAKTCNCFDGLMVQGEIPVHFISGFKYTVLTETLQLNKGKINSDITISSNLKIYSKYERKKKYCKFSFVCFHIEIRHYSCINGRTPFIFDDQILIMENARFKVTVLGLLLSY